MWTLCFEENDKWCRITSCPFWKLSPFLLKEPTAKSQHPLLMLAPCQSRPRAPCHCCNIAHLESEDQAKQNNLQLKGLIIPATSPDQGCTTSFPKPNLILSQTARLRKIKIPGRLQPCDLVYIRAEMDQCPETHSQNEKIQRYWGELHLAMSSEKLGRKYTPNRSQRLEVFFKFFWPLFKAICPIFF